jgi:bacillithiol synthase
MKSIQLRSVPGIPNYIYDIHENKNIVGFDYPTTISKDFAQEMQNFYSSFHIPRKTIVESLLKSIADKNIPTIVKSNIDALMDSSTLTIVTGQQTTIGGGPLLTLYKAITTIAHSRDVEKRTGIKIVPIFWMAAGDHNYPEFSQINWIDTKNELKRFRSGLAENRKPVGNILLGDLADNLIKAISEDMPDNDFKSDVLNQLSSSYQSDSTFANSFEDYLYSLLGEYGLVIFNPEDPGVKSVTESFWTKVVDNIEIHIDLISKDSDNILNSGYDIQVPVEKGRPPIFLLKDGNRHKVVLEGTSAKASNNIVLSIKQLKQLAKENPETLSAGVTLRPLLQSFLLPALAYVAGPHEMAYWGQISSTFELYNVKPPAVVHRACFTLIENKIRRKLDKLHIDEQSLFDSDFNYSEKTEKSNIEKDIEERLDSFDEVFKEYTSDLSELKELPEMKGIGNPIEKYLSKIEFQIDKIRSTISNRLQSSNNSYSSDLEMIKTHIMPGGIPQERVISPLYYLSRYGDLFIEPLINLSLESSGRHTFIDIMELIQ